MKEKKICPNCYYAKELGQRWICYEASNELNPSPIPTADVEREGYCTKYFNKEEYRVVNKEW